MGGGTAVSRGARVSADSLASEASATLIARELPASAGIRNRSLSLVGFSVLLPSLLLLLNITHHVAQDSLELCSLLCPLIHDPTASASQTLGLQARATRSGFVMS